MNQLDTRIQKVWDDFTSGALYPLVELSVFYVMQHYGLNQVDANSVLLEMYRRDLLIRRQSEHKHNWHYVYCIASDAARIRAIEQALQEKLSRDIDADDIEAAITYHAEFDEVDKGSLLDLLEKLQHGGRWEVSVRWVANRHEVTKQATGGDE